MFVYDCLVLVCVLSCVPSTLMYVGCVCLCSFSCTVVCKCARAFHCVFVRICCDCCRCLPACFWLSVYECSLQFGSLSESGYQWLVNTCNIGEKAIIFYSAATDAKFPNPSCCFLVDKINFFSMDFSSLVCLVDPWVEWLHIMVCQTRSRLLASSSVCFCWCNDAQFSFVWKSCNLFPTDSLFAMLWFFFLVFLFFFSAAGTTTTSPCFTFVVAWDAGGPSPTKLHLQLVCS